MNADTPCKCPKCGWLGTFHDAHEFQPGNGSTQYVCPRCSDEIEVQKLGQKGLDQLRQEHRLLPKMSFARHLSQEQREERMSQLERFFKHIHEGL